MIRWDGVSYCIEPDCHEPATHERPNGVARRHSRLRTRLRNPRHKGTEMSDETDINLGQIIGRDRVALGDRTGLNPYRIVAFWPEPTQLHIGEECDGNFGIAMTPEEVDRLIAWLSDWRMKVTTAPADPDGGSVQ